MANDAAVPSKKMIIVGSSCIGKTSLLMTYVQGAFPTDYVPTIFDNYNTGMGHLLPNHDLQLWDTAGGEEYDRLRPLSYPNTDVVLLAFSCTNSESYDRIEDLYLPEVRLYLPTVPIILVCLKVDRRDDPETIRRDQLQRFERVRLMTRQEGKDLAKRINAYSYNEVSSLNNIGVTELFESIKYCIIDNGVPKTRLLNKCVIS